jgi:hypothetical protein
MNTRLRWAWILVIAMSSAFGLVAGCSGDGGDGLSAQSGLVRCADCDDVQDWIYDVALEYMNLQLDRNLEDALNGGYYGDDTAGDDDEMDGGDDQAADDDGAPSDDDGEPNRGDDDYSDTNTQEEGVDEADIVKTDGDRLFIVAGGYLMTFDPRPAGETHELSRVDIEGVVRDMYLYGDYALVFSSIYPYELPETIWPDVPRENIYWNVLKMTLVDVSDLANPTVLREIYAEGNYVSSRRVNQSARVVVHGEAYFPEVVWWVDPYEAGCYDEDTYEIDEECLRAAYEELRARNRQIIENTPYEEWLPKYFEIRHGEGGDETFSGMLSQCADFFHPVEMLGNGILSVLTVNFDEAMTKQPDIAIIGDAQTVYASTEALYVAGAKDVYDYWRWEGDENLGESEIHKFDIAASPNEAIYKGSGTIAGWVLNQFSMSEKDGILRVATTLGQWTENFSNSVVTLKEDGGGLVKVGELTGIAPGEQLYAARFLGDKGFLVTFLRTDPLFTIDLSDPANPTLAGELLMPGYSTYLHPMDDTHLLAIGLQGDESGSVWGVKLSLFDVSDFANPREVASEAIGGYDAYSAAQYDHHAFLYYAKFDMLAIPIVQWNYGDDDVGDDDRVDDDETVPEEGNTKDGEGPFAGVYVYKVTAAEGFELEGQISHTDMVPEDGSDEYWYGMATPLRSVAIDTFLYTISDAGLVVTDLTSMEDVASIRLPWEDPYGGGYDDDWEDGEGGGGTEDGSDGGEVPPDEP